MNYLREKSSDLYGLFSLQNFLLHRMTFKKYRLIDYN